MSDKEGTQQASTSRTGPPSLGNRERSHIRSLWSGVFNKDQGGNSLTFFFLLQSFRRVGVLTRLGCVQGLLILRSFSSPFNLASGGFVAAPPLISNCSNLPFGTQGRPWRLESCLQEMGDKKASVSGSPTGTRLVSRSRCQAWLVPSEGYEGESVPCWQSLAFLGV